MLSLLYQESGCVVQEAAKATAEASFQEGGVLWRDVLRQQAHRAAGSVTAGLSICREKRKTGLLFHPHLIFWNLHVRVKLKNLCVSEGRSVLTLCSGVVLSGVESKVQLTLEHLSVVSVNQLINTLVDHVGLMTDGRSSHLPEWQFKYLNTFVFRVCSHRFTWWKPRKSWMVGDA